uniref:Angiopoietin-like 4 n=1 Tax=Cyprinus carpio TaxID=7962 RepID=A0A8C2L015_CYPCA
MKVALANLLCITVLASSGTSFPLERRGAATGKEKRVQYAAWDDVNVLAHGLLQLGQGLKEHVDKTKGQVKDITIKMKVFNVTISELGKLTQRLQEDSEALKAKAQSLEERENLLLNVSVDLREKTEELLKDRKKDHERMNKLEEKVDGLMQGEGLEAAKGNYSDARTIQWMLEAQNKRIDDLVERIKQQQEKLEKQNVRIRTLQNQIHMNSERSSLKRKEDDVHLNASSEQRDSPVAMASDCHELFLRGETTSGLYTIQPTDSEPFEVFCEMTPGEWRKPNFCLFYLSIYLTYRLKRASMASLFINHIGYCLPSPKASLRTACNPPVLCGWWFSNCGRSNLNGRYFVTPAPKQRHQRKQGVFWKTWRGRYHPLKTTTMMIAPAEIENKS